MSCISCARDRKKSANFSRNVSPPFFFAVCARKSLRKRSFESASKQESAAISSSRNDAADHEIIILFHSLYLEVRHDGVLDGNYHNLGKDIVKNLPEYLSDPYAIVRTDNNRILLLSTVNNYKGRNGIISVELNTVKDINSIYQKYNLVITVFSAKDNYTKNTITKHGVKVEYEKEGLAQVNPQLRTSLAIINAKPSTDSISNPDGNVNTS